MSHDEDRQEFNRAREEGTLPDAVDGVGWVWRLLFVLVVLGFVASIAAVIAVAIYMVKGSGLVL